MSGVCQSRTRTARSGPSHRRSGSAAGTRSSGSSPTARSAGGFDMSAAPPNALREPREPQLKSMRAGEILFGEEENKDAPHLVGLGSGSPGSRGSHPITAAVRVVHEAAVLGVTLSAVDGFIDWSAKQAPPEAFLVRLAAAKPELVQLLDG